MKLVINEYNLFNPKIKNNLDIMCISDIHSDTNRLIKIKKIIKQKGIKNILIPGDLVDSVNDKYNEELLNIIKDISKMSSIYIVKGNHDMISLNKMRKRSFSKNNKFYKKLSLIKNVNILDDDNYYISLNKDINIYSLTLPLKWYKEREKISNFKKYIKEDLKIVDNNKLNILLSHTPKGIIVNDLIRQDIEYIKNMNLILCGHMHAGLKPICFRKNNKHKGLVGPYKTFLPKEAYGIYNNNSSSMLISGGVTKLSHQTGILLRPFRNLYSSEVEIIHLIKGKENSLEFNNKNK